jgi:hypothetical protein
MRPSTILATFSLAVLAFGQAEKNGIEGRVLEPQGAPFSGAAVQARSVPGGQLYKATSTAGGQYTISALPPGKYDITVNVNGLKNYEKKGVTVPNAEILHLDIHLEESTQLSTLGEDALASIANLNMHHPPSGPTPRTADGKPDFSGVWWRFNTTDPGKPEFLPAAERIAAQRVETNRKDSPQAHCEPSAVTRDTYPLFQLVQSKAFLVIIMDDESPGYRQIYLDGRPHPKDLNPAWYGHAIGRWDGDTLVVDRTGFDERTWLDQTGHPHSDKLHVVERFRRPDLGRLEVEMTIEDPGVLSKPWVMKRVSDLSTEEINEFICTENNRDVSHLVGK